MSGGRAHQEELPLESVELAQPDPYPHRRHHGQRFVRGAQAFLGLPELPIRVSENQHVERLQRLKRSSRRPRCQESLTNLCYARRPLSRLRARPPIEDHSRYAPRSKVLLRREIDETACHVRRLSCVPTEVQE